MSREPDNVSPWCRNIVYMFRQGGPTLLSILCMGAVAWQAMTQVSAAVTSLQLCVKESNAVMVRFMENVAADHKKQLETLQHIQSSLKPVTSQGYGDVR